MKKHNSKTLALLSFLAVTFMLFSSCDGVIFDTIRDEVKLSDAKASGDIQNIVRYNYDGDECVFAATGKIYYRSVAEDVVDSKEVGFAEFPKPSGLVYALAADSSYLYAVSLIIEEDDDGYNSPTKRNLYCYNGESWEEIWSVPYSRTVTVLFCTNAPQNGHRRAYLRHDSKVYELSGETEPAEMALVEDNSSTTALTTTPTEGTRSCAYFGGSVYFSSSYAMTTNETAESDATAIYYADGDNVHYSMDGSEWLSSDLDCGKIISLGVTADYLLAGTESGIAHTPLTDNVPSNGNADFSTNAESTLSSYYEVPAILVINPALEETGGTIYAASVTSSPNASLNNVGLWSYYASKGEWNRE